MVGIKKIYSSDFKHFTVKVFGDGYKAIRTFTDDEKAEMFIALKRIEIMANNKAVRTGYFYPNTTPICLGTEAYPSLKAIESIVKTRF